MYVVTFYSFKGGVGRSIALVNIGVQLAQSGKKVLLVDFDLEAPGLPTFSLKKPQEEIPGIVEYVSHYIATGESPDVADYVYESEAFPSGGKLFVMPVGKQNGSYSHRLNSIDWRKLYTEQAGYLFIEDLKRQWAQRIAPDYVLVDSRTGHSDVEGICTRQLPNAVCLLFFPNEQNLQGLKRIVANIKSDNEKLLHKAIEMHFVVSNVPDLDDEDQILGKTMRKFRNELGYKELASEIHHYNSLSLLNQEIFSLARPNSRLTKEYKVLTSAITRQNSGDREAVIIFLKSVHRDLRDVMGEGSPENFENKLSTILENFPMDGEINFRSALAFELLGDSRLALSMLAGPIVENGYPTAEMYATRARLNFALSNSNETLRDLTLMLDAEGATLRSLLEVVSLMDKLNSDLFDGVPNSRAIQSLSKTDQMFLASQSEGSKKRLRANATILRQLRQSKTQEDGLSKDYLDDQLALASIGVGDFGTAIEILQPDGGNRESLSIHDAFNLAMALWGRDRIPPANLFEIVIRKDSEQPPVSSRTANYKQCMSICQAVLGNRENARGLLVASRNTIGGKTVREFSAWTYSRVPSKVFVSHLDEIERFINGEHILPRYIVEGRDE